MATLMHVTHENGKVITGEVMNWNVDENDASLIVFAREKSIIAKEISEARSLLDSEPGSEDDNTRLRDAIRDLENKLAAIESNPPSLKLEDRVSRYLSTVEEGEGYVLADGSWPD